MRALTVALRCFRDFTALKTAFGVALAYFMGFYGAKAGVYSSFTLLYLTNKEA